MLKLYIYVYGLIYNLAKYIFINFKTYISVQLSDCDDLYINITTGAPVFDYIIQVILLAEHPHKKLRF